MSLVEKLQHYIATINSDFPASFELLSDDVEWINRLPAHVPFGGEYRGRQAVVGYFQLMAETFVIGDYLMDEFEFIEAGDTLVVVGYEKDGKVLPTNTIFDLHFVWVIKFNQQGRIRFFQEHNDTAAIGDAFKPVSVSTIRS